MKAIVSAIIFCLLPLSAVMAEDWSTTVKRATVRVQVVDQKGAIKSSGSGIFVSPRGHILTAKHVLEKGDYFLAPQTTKIQVMVLDENLGIKGTYEVKLEERSIHKDIVLLQYPLVNLKYYLPVGDANLVDEAQPLRAFGFAGGGNTIRSVPGNRTSQTDWEVTIPISGGYSGGPIVKQGCSVLLGIAQGVLETPNGEIIPGRFKMVPAINATTLLSNVGVHVEQKLLCDPGGAQDLSPATRFSGTAKIEFVDRLGEDWSRLADHLQIRLSARRRWEQGEEGRGIWAWLEDRKELTKLVPALRAIGRADLANLFEATEKATQRRTDQDTTAVNLATSPPPKTITMKDHIVFKGELSPDVQSRYEDEVPLILEEVIGRCIHKADLAHKFINRMVREPEVFSMDPAANVGDIEIGIRYQHVKTGKAKLMAGIDIKNGERLVVSHLFSFDSSFRIAMKTFAGKIWKAILKDYACIPTKGLRLAILPYSHEEEKHEEFARLYAPQYLENYLEVYDGEGDMFEIKHRNFKDAYDDNLNAPRSLEELLQFDEFKDVQYFLTGNFIGKTPITIKSVIKAKELISIEPELGLSTGSDSGKREKYVLKVVDKVGFERGIQETKLKEIYVKIGEDFAAKLEEHYQNQ